MTAWRLPDSYIWASVATRYNSSDAKDQLILKGLFGILKYLQKRTNEFFHSTVRQKKKKEFVRSFFGGIIGLKKTFRICLTFKAIIFWFIRPLWNQRQRRWQKSWSYKPALSCTQPKNSKNKLQYNVVFFWTTKSTAILLIRFLVTQMAKNEVIIFQQSIIEWFQFSKIWPYQDFYKSLT